MLDKLTAAPLHDHDVTLSIFESDNAARVVNYPEPTVEEHAPLQLLSPPAPRNKL